MEQATRATVHVAQSPAGALACRARVASLSASRRRRRDRRRRPERTRSTFTKDVAPILQQKCQVCHQPNSIAPMSLLTYEDAKKFARAIKTKVGARVMPPWHIDKTIGIQRVQERSQPDRRADRHDRRTGSTPARRWAIRRTCRRRRRFPIRPAGSSPKQFGEPDLVIKSPPYTLAARTQDKWFRPGHRDRPHRAALGARDRDQAVVPGRPPDRAPRADDARAAGRRASPASPHERARRADERRAVHGVGGRQDRRDLRRRRRQADAARARRSAGKSTCSRSARRSRTTRSSSAIYFYPKGVVPKHRTVLRMFDVEPRLASSTFRRTRWR